MATAIPSNKPDMPATTIRELITSLVRKNSKVATRGKLNLEGANGGTKLRRPSSYSESGVWGRDFSDSFLELSSEVSPIDDETWDSNATDNLDLKNINSELTENGNLWKDEVRRKCVQLTKLFEKQLLEVPKEQQGLNLKISEGFPQRLAKKIVNIASSEPCGLRGCCVYLRLLHEDVVYALTSQNSNLNYSQDRAEKCASWPEPPAHSRGIRYDGTGVEKQPLDFRFLPDMDSFLTTSFNAESSTDSGFGEAATARPRHRRVQHSVSSPSMSVLPKLSSASRLQVACVDLGRLDLCDADAVPTFEVYIYLAPATSWTWWLRKLFSSSLKMDKQDNGFRNNKGASRSVSIVPDFTIVKRKLYRSRSNSVEVIRCPMQT